MEIYNKFAEVYDIFMESVPYKDWVDYIEAIWEYNNLSPQLVLDLGCGTGSITAILHEREYDMIGIDISEDMLMQAREKLDFSPDVMFLNQDMRKFELYGTVDSIVCLCDSLNYILEEEELLKVFKLVNNYLNPKGLFIFDLNTEYKFQNILADNNFSLVQKDCSYIWENFYDMETKINEYCTNFFILDKETKKYEKFQEIHYEKAYSIETISNLIISSGMELVDIYDEGTFEPPTAESQRIYFVCREKGKSN